MTATQAVTEPTTSSADLARIVQHQPGLWTQAAAHPNASSTLLYWLGQNGDDTVRAVIAARRPADNQSAEPIPTQTGRRAAIALTATVVVVTASILAAMNPWQSPDYGPTLTTSQFANMLETNPDLFGDITWTPTQELDILTYRQQPSFPHDNCANSITAMGATACLPIESGVYNQSIAMLFDTTDNARAMGQRFLAARGTIAHDPVIQTGVWMWGNTNQTAPNMDAAVAQYGNVIICYESDHTTWQQWQDAAPTLQRAISQAAKR